METLDIQIMNLDELERRLGKLAPQARKIMRMAVNDTAGKARTEMRRKAQETYVVKTGKFNKGLTLSKATNATLTATLHSNGKNLPLSYFEIRKNGKRMTGKGHQLTSTSPVPVRKNENKSFVTKVDWKNKKGEAGAHRGLFYRLGKKRYPIMQIYGLSVPVMLGGKRVYGQLEPVIQSTLYDRLQHHIDYVLGRL